MRLFGRVNTQVTNEDRPFLFAGTIFTLAYRLPVGSVPISGALLPPVFNLSPPLAMFVMDVYDGSILADWTEAEDVTFGTNEHGFAELRGRYPMNLYQAFTFYNLNDPPHLVVTDGLKKVYEGRLEDIGIDEQGVAFGAFGYWRALSDLRVSALFADSDLSNWYSLTDDEVAGVVLDRFEVDKYNRLYAAPKKDETYSSATAYCSFGYRVPDLSLTQIERVVFNFAFDMPSPWKVELARCDADWSELSVVWSLTGNGSLQSGTGHAVDVSPCDALRFTLFYNGTSATYTGESGDDYFRLTNLVVSAFDATDVYADDIMKVLVEEISMRNPSQLSADTSQIQSPGLALADALYEDARPADIANQLSVLGDDQDVPQPWTAAVWEDRRLQFAPKGERANHWYVDVASLQIERSFQDVVNTAYGVYRENGRGNRRTAEASSGLSEVVRMEAVDTTTTSAGTAVVHRDAYLSDSSVTRPRATLRTLGLFDEMGAQHPLYRARAGDYLTLRNLPPDLGELNNLRTFRIGSTRYNAATDELEPEPETSIPSLAILVARREQGV